MRITKFLKISQSAMEFVVLASFMLLVILGFFTVTSSRVLQAREEADDKIAEDAANLVLREIQLATSVSNGYSRIFYVPQTINGVNYSISLIDNRELTVNYLGHENIKFLPANITGNIGKGFNEIKKNESIIYVNAVPPQCNNNKDDDLDLLTDANDPGCYANCDYLNPARYRSDYLEKDTCKCNSVAKCCENGFGTHYQVFDKDCGGKQCWSICLSFSVLTMRTPAQKAISFRSDGNLILKGTLQSNSNPSPSPDDDFIVKDRNGNYLSVLNLVTGNMVIKGSLLENQPTLTPSPAQNNFIVKDDDNNIIAYIDESGNFLMKGALTQNGNP